MMIKNPTIASILNHDLHANMMTCNEDIDLNFVMDNPTQDPCSDQEVNIQEANLKMTLPKIQVLNMLYFNHLGDYQESRYEGKPNTSNIKQAHNSMKSPIVGNIRNKEGRISNQKKCIQESMANIDEGNETNLEELLLSRRQ